jgi:S1-C subfamily serine protease
VPILVGVAAVLVSLASVAVIVDRLRNDDERVFTGDFFTELEPGEFRFEVPFRALLGVTVEVRDGALVVHHVQPDSAAEHAGVEPGDVILRAAGEDVASVAALREVIGNVAAGEQYDLVVRRDGSEQTLRATRPDQMARAFPLIPGASDGEPFDAFLDQLADEVEGRLRERGITPPTPSPQRRT